MILRTTYSRLIQKVGSLGENYECLWFTVALAPPSIWQNGVIFRFVKVSVVGHFSPRVVVWSGTAAADERHISL